MPTLTLRGARAHTLRDLDLDLQLGTWTAVTGISGSGKTTLVFDVLVREGRRRWWSGSSARARHALGKLGRAEAGALTGLPVPIGIGDRSLTAHARSTVGTASGVLDWLRLLYARAATDPGGHPLSRSHFSFNHPLGRCEVCVGLGIEDRVDPSMLVADPSKSLRDGALVPTLKSGYTVYSQVTLEVMDHICQAHGFDVHTPWQDLTEAQRDVVLYGTTALTVPFGKHSLESRMRWEGITARPRSEGHYRGLIPVITETLARNRNPSVLRFVRSVPCTACDGTRLARPGRQAVWREHRLPQLLSWRVDALQTWLAAQGDDPVLQVVRASVQPRLLRMTELALGHLSLDRPSGTLSGGEAQRLQLAAQLTLGLSGLLVALDEPTLGLHPGDQPGLVQVLRGLQALGNTLVLVEHDPLLVRHADRVLGLGPGAGPAGGRWVADGSPGPESLPVPPPPVRAARVEGGRGELTGATLHGLQDVALSVPLGALTVVRGPSGAGKSSLLFGTLLPALEGRRGGPFTALSGWPESPRVRAIDASPIGRTPRSTPATYTGIFDIVRKRFAATDDAKTRGWNASRFSYNAAAGRCERCEGLGVQRVGLHLLADVERACETCGGGRYADETRAVRWRDLDIAQVLDLTAEQAAERWSDDTDLGRRCGALVQLGLGHLRLGQSSTTLSRGEAQRVKLATWLGEPRRTPAIVLLDEPDRGLHPSDVHRLLVALEGLVAAGNTVIAISHLPQVWAAADHSICMRAGRVVPCAPLRIEAPQRVVLPPPPRTMDLSGVRTHTLCDLSVSLPHDALVGIVGVSGSGKSSLVVHTLAAEASRRLAESLPFAVRRNLRRVERPDLDRATGLRPTVTLRQGRGRAGPRSTVAIQTEIDASLRLLWSRCGRGPDGRTPLTAGHFSPNGSLGACRACSGTGRVSRCRPERLITDPSLPLGAGALAGTKPGRFFEEPDGQYMATLRAAVAQPVDWTRPWVELSEPVQQVALWGAGDRVVSVSWQFRRGSRTGEHHFEGPWVGLCALVEAEAAVRARRRDAVAWAAPLRVESCGRCGGSRLDHAPDAVTVGGLRLAELRGQRVHVARDTLTGLLGTLGPDDLQVAREVLADTMQRLDDLVAVGLAHLHLDRGTDTLSGGEHQRVRLVGVLGGGLTQTTVVLDEPASGLHSDEVAQLLTQLRRLKDAGNSVVVVTHRPAVVRAMDHLIELGPGAGPRGGRVVDQGPTEQVLAGHGATASALRQQARLPAAPEAPPVRLLGVHARGLPDLDLTLPGAGLVVVTGPSGSGKTTLLVDVIAASVQAGAPRGCAAVEGLGRWSEVHLCAVPERRAPIEALGLLAELQRLYGAVPGHAVPKRAFSYRSAAGRCETCRGTGHERVALDVLADLQLPCTTCGGQRYRPEVLAVRWRELTVAQWLDRPALELTESPLPEKIAVAVRGLIRVGLGHLSLGRIGASLSEGEAQRLALTATVLRLRGPAILLLDEPATGLHEQDLAGLIEVLGELAAAGSLVIAAEHRRGLARAAHHELRLDLAR